MEVLLLNDVYIADTFFKRFLGYMFQKQPEHEAILIKPCNSIHSYFMKFSIDVLFINNNNEIIKKVDGLKPGKVIFKIEGATMVLEAKEGTFKEIEVGQILEV